MDFVTTAPLRERPRASNSSRVTHKAPEAFMKQLGNVTPAIVVERSIRLPPARLAAAFSSQVFRPASSRCSQPPPRLRHYGSPTTRSVESASPLYAATQ